MFIYRVEKGVLEHSRVSQLASSYLDCRVDLTCNLTLVMSKMSWVMTTFMRPPGIISWGYRLLRLLIQNHWTDGRPKVGCQLWCQRTEWASLRNVPRITIPNMGGMLYRLSHSLLSTPTMGIILSIFPWVDLLRAIEERKSQEVSVRLLKSHCYYWILAL